MRLYFLRHGHAGSRDEWTRPDEERPLTRRGVAATREAARGMRWLDLGLDLILSSPYVRAQQTALIVAETLQLAVTTSPALAPGCSLTSLAEALGAHLAPHRAPDATPAADAPRAATRSVLLVGHEPDFGEIIGAMIGRKGTGAIAMKKGALCRLDLDPDVGGWRWAAANLRGSATLAWLLTAKQLGRLSC